jgi:cyclic dehypoxanthinyl futalosine synthase
VYLCGIKVTNMDLPGLYDKALNFEFLTAEEGIFLFEKAPLTELMVVANELRNLAD